MNELDLLFYTLMVLNAITNYNNISQNVL